MRLVRVMTGALAVGIGLALSPQGNGINLDGAGRAEAGQRASIADRAVRLADGTAPTLAADSPYASYEWVKTFSEEFSASEPPIGEKGTWETTFPWQGRVLESNREMQVYVDPDYAGTGSKPLGINPFRVADGYLSIIAAPTSERDRGSLGGAGYTSGLLTTFSTFSQKYGFFEIRARIPKGKGLWPAFWLLPDTEAWPPEIDVLEVLGDDPTKLHMSVHYSIAGRHVADTTTRTVPSLAEEFHVFGVLWQPDNITWFLDGEEMVSKAAPAGLDTQMYLLVNLAVGGNWPGQPDGTTVFPAEYVVDYVRAFASPTQRKRK